MWLYSLSIGLLLLSTGSNGYSSSIPGEVLSIIDVTDGKFVLFDDNLKTILNKVPKGMEVGVVSIAGEYRKGKSFLINFVLQYLQHRREHAAASLTGEGLEDVIKSGSHPWLKDIERNSGFQFKSGTVRDTTGINVWSEPFVITKKDGKKMAVLVMDSQGLYDAQTTGNDNVRLFTMVSMLSSTLMLNTQGNINFNQFKQLEYFMKYAKSGTCFSQETKMFQTLTFLLRDFTLEDSYGWDAGQDVLDAFINVANDQPKENQEIARKLKSAFDKINSFALPGPGNKVFNKNFDGSLVKIDSLFMEQLEEFVVSVTEDLEPRHPLSLNLNGVTFGEHVRTLVKQLNDNLSPDEMIRLQEAAITNKVNDRINNLLNQHADALREVIDKRSLKDFLQISDHEIALEISMTHQRTVSQTIQEQRNDATMNIILKQGSDGKPVTAIQVLEEKLNERFESMKSELLQIASSKRKEAQAIVDREEEVKRIHKEREEELKRMHEKQEELARRLAAEKQAELQRQHEAHEAEMRRQQAELERQQQAREAELRRKHELELERERNRKPQVIKETRVEKECCIL